MSNALTCVMQARSYKQCLEIFNSDKTYSRPFETSEKVRNYGCVLEKQSNLFLISTKPRFDWILEAGRNMIKSGDASFDEMTMLSLGIIRHA